MRTPMFTPFSKRARQKQGKGPGPNEDDHLPDALNNKVIHICNELIAKLPKVFFRGGEAFFTGARQALCHELGLMRLTDQHWKAEVDVWSFFLRQQKVETCLDTIEIVFACVVAVVQGD